MDDKRHDQNVQEILPAEITQRIKHKKFLIEGLQATFGVGTLKFSKRTIPIL
jgi:hypothetical protein